MKTIKSKAWYDRQIATRESIIRNITLLYSNMPDPPIHVKNHVMLVQDELNLLVIERDMYYT